MTLLENVRINVSQIDDEFARREMIGSHLSFTESMFLEQEGLNFIEAGFHPVLCDTLDKCFTGEIKRLIINIPPGFGKTLLAVHYFITRGFAINPMAKFLHISYSQPLVLDNSTSARGILGLDCYRKHWEVDLKVDTNAKGLWRTTAGGALRAASSGEAITGFRAGTMDKTKFTGAMIIDDPLKPDDALSETKRTFVNNRWHNTFKSRPMHPDIPVIVIMQRLHIDDFSAFLLNGGSRDLWHHLILPVEIDNNVKPEIHSHAIPVNYDLPNGPLWAEKADADEIEILRADDYVAQAQYWQRPVPLGGAVFKEKMIEERSVDDFPNMKYRFLVADTALTAKTSSDWTAIGCYGWGADKRLYLLDMMRFKMEVPEMEVAAAKFWEKHKVITGAHERIAKGPLRKFLVENKASGIGLIQRLRRKRVPVVSIERDRDKLARALDCTPQLAVSALIIPDEAPWKLDFIKEILQFTGADDKHDDQVDTVMDAVEETMIKGSSMADVM